MPLLVALSVLGLTELLGAPVRQDGYSLRPPRDFHLAHMELFHGSHVGAIGPATEGQRALSAAFFDGEGDDAASLLIAVVDGDQGSGPAARDALANQVLRHFRDELGVSFLLERTEQAGERVEVLGSVREGAQLRRVLVAAWPGVSRHVVATWSVPSGRWDALKPALHDSLESFRAEPQNDAGVLPRRGGVLVAAVLAGLLLTSWGLWRRRRRPVS
jgi:hypothetical protein